MNNSVPINAIIPIIKKKGTKIILTIGRIQTKIIVHSYNQINFIFKILIKTRYLFNNVKLLTTYRLMVINNNHGLYVVKILYYMHANMQHKIQKYV